MAAIGDNDADGETSPWLYDVSFASPARGWAALTSPVSGRTTWLLRQQ